METLWVTHWVQRLLEKQKALKNATGKNTVFFADRSPYSAVFYAKTGGQLLRPVIAAMIAELANNNIHIFTVHIKVCVFECSLYFFLSFAGVVFDTTQKNKIESNFFFIKKGRSRYSLESHSSAFDA